MHTAVVRRKGGWIYLLGADSLLRFLGVWASTVPSMGTLGLALDSETAHGGLVVLILILRCTWAGGGGEARQQGKARPSDAGGRNVPHLPQSSMQLLSPAIIQVLLECFDAVISKQ